MKIKGNFWIEKDGKSFLGKGRIELLKKIDKYGSISRAAKEMKMSYKAAWDAVDIINKLAKDQVVEKMSGGKGGGGTRVTEYGKKLIDLFESAEEKFRNDLLNLEEFLKKEI
ncbi:molybdenum-pterin-binding protein [Nautilia profundicola AmH]|uniref:Molybdenum-pterin-binding protein n=1 Tax=Nautilia profundicola (strain ATCC BAA-1463 / DSM 18972 / AmH) TaxID=598659 RepID=B9L913_NAUPA|nr:LysR family transcriptional regulator [Nautilia profundicola]ACM92289.1 molybdenum-pterin-binding protein [Nautilia profundicola AmH]